jgi:hypothetical protein
MPKQKDFAHWLFEQNVLPWLTAFSWIIGFELTDADKKSVEAKVDTSDFDSESWCHFEFTGRHSVKVRFAKGPRPGIVHVRGEVPKHLHEQVEVALIIFGHFRLVDPSEQ